MLALVILTGLLQAPASRPAFAAPPAVADKTPISEGWSVQGLTTWDFRGSVLARLRAVDRGELLAGFQKRPGKQAWVGEHVGKWLHAASMPDLGMDAEITEVRDALLACQEADGYLGTYTKDKRFGLYPGSDWDVWVHKYVLIGLLAQYARTGHAPSLDACRKIGNLLCETFGPGKRSILSAGTHVGMAATSVLEPMVLLYRWTGEKRYLEFCKYVVSSWEEPGGPDILRRLLAGKHVYEVGNGKAYEMLSNFVGICELYRQTGEARLLEAVQSGWRDIVENQLLPTGSGSWHEFWQREPKYPTRAEDQPCETCVTVTWLQLNVQLFRLTNDRRYLDQIQLTFFNQLAGAQTPLDGKWCYFTPSEGPKNPTSEMHCCGSSGPRGFTLAESIAVTAKGNRVQFNIPGDATGTARVGNDSVKVTMMAGRYPFPGGCFVAVDPKEPVDLELAVYLPEGSTIGAVDAETPVPKGLVIAKDGYATIRRKFTKLETFSFRIDTPIQVLRGEKWNRPGYVGFQVGPLVLVGTMPTNEFRERVLPAFELNVELAKKRIVAYLERAALIACGEPTDEAAPEFTLRPRRPVKSASLSSRRALKIRSFMGAGLHDDFVNLWFLDDKTPDTASLLWLGEEGFSRAGNQPGHIQDNDSSTFRVTFNSQRAPRDEFSVTLGGPVLVDRVVYRHGRTFHDGGWFDAAAARPRIEVRRSLDGPWESIGELPTYPATTATDPQGLRGGEPFELRLPRAMTVFAVRVVGIGACGDDPTQNFSSCAELEAYSK